MSDERRPPYGELRRRLEAAESALEAIRSGKVDTILGDGQTLVVRLAAAEARERHVKQVLLAIRNVNQLIVAETDRRRLAARACETLADTLGYHNAWMALTDRDGGVTCAASAGFDGGFTEVRELLDAGEPPRCFRKAIQTEEPVVVLAPSKECIRCPLSAGYADRSGLACALRHGSRTYGVLAVSVPGEYASDPEELDLFAELAGDLGFALYRLEVERERERALDRLAESEERLKLAVSGAELGTWDWDVPTGRVEFNDRWSTMLGLDPEVTEPSLDTWKELVHPDDLPVAMEALQSHLEGETEVYSAEYRMRHADDGWVWVLDRGKVIERDRDGKPLRACGTHQDITGIKSARESLRFTEMVLSQIQDRVILTDLEGRITFVNEAVCKMLGRPRSELVGEHVSTLGDDPETGPTQGQVMQEALEEGCWRGEVTNYRADGTPVLLDSRVSLVRDREGEPVALCGISTDITDRKAAQERLVSSERQKNLILNATTELVAYYDTDLRVQWANSTAGKSVGLRPEDLVGRHCYEAWHDSRRPCEGCPVIAARDTGIPHSAEQQTPDGRMWSIRGYPVVGDSGEIVGLVEFGMDITEKRKAQREREQLERQFQRAQRMESVGRLAGGIAHDLNNLLSPILGYGEMLAEEAPEGGETAEKLEQILGAGRRARDLVQQLLAFSRRQTLDFRPLDLSAVVEGFGQLIRRAIREDVAMETHLHPDLPAVMGDRGQLEQILMNLAVNAQDAMPEGGTLTIRTEVSDLDELYASEHGDLEPGGYVVLSVEDTGVGMTAETREHVFEPFFTTKKEGLGTGLGLSTVYGIVKQHKGNVWIYSEPGMGTTFKLYIPVCAGEVEEEQAPGDQAAAGGGSETILLAEDDPQVGRMAREMLRSQGYTVFAVSSGAEALELLRGFRGTIDLLLTDIIMPDMDGITLYAEVRQIGPDIRVLYMSGYTRDVISSRRPMEDGAGFLQKPFTLKTLAGMVRRVLDA